jgi:hypothetical protein
VADLSREGELEVERRKERKKKRKKKQRVFIAFHEVQNDFQKT